MTIWYLITLKPDDWSNWERKLCNMLQEWWIGKVVDVMKVVENRNMNEAVAAGLEQLKGCKYEGFRKETNCLHRNMHMRKQLWGIKGGLERWVAPGRLGGYISGLVRKVGRTKQVENVRGIGDWRVYIFRGDAVAEWEETDFKIGIEDWIERLWQKFLLLGVSGRSYPNVKALQWYFGKFCSSY